MELPQPRHRGEMSLEEAVKARRTIRNFTPQALTLQALSQLCWAAYGITQDRGYKRAAASGGATYPMDLYGVLGQGGVHSAKEGVYHYDPAGHTLSRIKEGDLREPLARASLGQMWMASAPLNLVITAEYDRICARYGERGVRYALIEAGHMGQNIFLQAEALGLGAGIVGAFQDRQVIQVMHIPTSHEPLLIMPVGHKG